MILVFGATGNVGGAVVRDLVRAGADVRAVVRDPQRGRASVPAGVEVVVGDLQEAATLRPALTDTEAAFLLSGYAGIDALVPEMAAVRRRLLQLLRGRHYRRDHRTSNRARGAGSGSSIIRRVDRRTQGPVSCDPVILTSR